MCKTITRRRSLPDRELCGLLHAFADCARRDLQTARSPEGSPSGSALAARFRKPSVESGKYQLLHLSVRGVLNETAPLFSFAALSSNIEAKEDGLLESREILSLDLKSDLVVMTGGELAWPKAGAIRAMTGLTWAWFVAGCPATVVNRWRGEGASDLTLEFHRRIKTSSRKESKAKSWQAAVQQLLNREERRHPYFWAGFAMLGDAR